MKSILNQLPDDEAILLMYLANELPQGDRQKVELRLASDEAFAAKLREMSELREFCQNSIRALDERESADHLESAAMRRATRMLQQWALRQRRLGEAAPMVIRPTPWLRYGLSAAAMMGLVYLVWWSNRPVPPAERIVREDTPEVNQSVQDTLSPDVKLTMLIHGMDAAAADDAPNRQLVAVGVKPDDINFSVDLSRQDDSQ
jgi:anti-sigma factor RsiW